MEAAAYVTFVDRRCRTAEVALGHHRACVHVHQAFLRVRPHANTIGPISCCLDLASSPHLDRHVRKSQNPVGVAAPGTEKPNSRNALTSHGEGACHPQVEDPPQGMATVIRHVSRLSRLVMRVNRRWSLEPATEEVGNHAGCVNQAGGEPAGG